MADWSDLSIHRADTFVDSLSRPKEVSEVARELLDEVEDTAQLGTGVRGMKVHL